MEIEWFGKVEIGMEFNGRFIQNYLMKNPDGSISKAKDMDELFDRFAEAMLDGVQNLQNNINAGVIKNV